MATAVEVNLGVSTVEVVMKKELEASTTWEVGWPGVPVGREVVLAP